MSLILMLATVTAAPVAGAEQPGFDSMQQAAQTLQSDLQTGTLLVSKGDCLAIKIFSRSDYTHVAAVVLRDGKPFVYDSTSGVGVRYQTLENYLKSQSPDEIYLFHPRKKFSKNRAGIFENYLDSQLGKPYAIRHHLTGKRADGVHCAEYMTDALMSCKLIHANQPSRVSPASLVEGITKTKLYESAHTVKLKQPPAPLPKSANWCARIWIDTKRCTNRCCIKMKRWILCR